MNSPMYVLWDMSDDSIEGLVFVSRSLEMVQAYADLPRALWGNADLRICQLVDVSGDPPPMQGCAEPPGLRVTCPRCSQTEYKIEFAEWRHFRPLQVQVGAAPRGPGLVCLRCETLFRVEFN